MHELWIALGGLIAGSAAAMGVTYWHSKQIRQAVGAERQRYSQSMDNLRFDLSASERRGADLAAQQATREAYDRGYVDGMRYGAEMSAVEQMAFSLDQKQPARLVRLHRYGRDRDGATI